MTIPTVILLVAMQDTSDRVVAAADLEGRPEAVAVSPIQTLVDRARPGETVDIPAGTYQGDLYLDKPVTLVGHGRPKLIGSGNGSVIRIRADRVAVSGVDVDGRYGGRLETDASGVHVAGRFARIEDVRIERAFFGVYLREADDATVSRVVVRGDIRRDPGEQGSGIHVYNSARFRLVDNDIASVRDGIYIQSSNGGMVARNTARDLRYGLHYMYSDDNVFEDNRFEGGAAGAAIMYSRRVAFRRNHFAKNRGFASVGLLLKDCEEVIAEDNLIVDNARGLFLEGGYGNVIRRNLIAQSDVAVVLFASVLTSRFEGNAFVANLSPLQLVGRHTDTGFDGNYWSDADEPDLDGDGVRDRPYRLSSVFDHLRENLAAADLMASGPAARALGAAERAFPILRPVDVLDRRPLAHAPAFLSAPGLRAAAANPDAAGLVASAVAASLGGLVWVWSRRTRMERAS